MNPVLTLIDKPLYIFDLETFYDTFTFGGKFHGDNTGQTFEVSWRQNQTSQLLSFLKYLQSIDAFMVGYNNLGFDAPIVEDLIKNPYNYNAQRAYQLAQKIIESQKISKFSPYTVNLGDRTIHQVDLMKIWHYDNDAKRTRLKDLQFAMRSRTVEDLPYDPHKPLSSQQIDNLIKYMVHDITETEKFLNFTAERVKLRRDLIKSGALKGDVLNWNDTKIGEKFFVSKLGLKGKVRGTDRLTVAFQDVILPKIDFRKEQFLEVLEQFKTKRWIKGDKDANELIPFNRTLSGLDIHFGSGGIHGSVKSRIYKENKTHKIVDIDVSGMYPAVGIANKFYPEHLGDKFVEVYKQLKFDRKQHKKGTAMNAVLKLAQNGAYGKSNSEFSPLFDVKYLFSITINGHLQNLQLFERLSFIPGIEFIQNNTDGMTVYLPREHEWLFDLHKEAWEKETSLELEQVEYSAMYVRDVNNYLAVKKDGTKKRIGAYWFAESWEDYDAGPGKWHTDVSMMIVPKIAEAAMTTGQDPEYLLKNFTHDPFDFMIRQKVQGKQVCYIGNKETQRTARYYVSVAGEPMKVVRPAPGPIGWYKRKPKTPETLYNQVIKENGSGLIWDARIHTGKEPKPGKKDERGKYEDTTSSICSGFKVEDCCDSTKFNYANIDYKFYLEEINKLIIKG
jgi:hypothetical protein